MLARSLVYWSSYQRFYSAHRGSEKCSVRLGVSGAEIISPSDFPFPNLYRGLQKLFTISYSSKVILMFGWRSTFGAKIRKFRPLITPSFKLEFKRTFLARNVLFDEYPMNYFCGTRPTNEVEKERKRKPVSFILHQGAVLRSQSKLARQGVHLNLIVY